MDCAGKDLALHIPAERDVIIRALRMGDAYGVLFDDGAFVEIRSDVMRRRADQLHAALVGLLIRVRTLEAWKE